MFLEDIKMDYQNAGKTLRAVLDKFKKRYNAAKALSIPDYLPISMTLIVT